MLVPCATCPTQSFFNLTRVRVGEGASAKREIQMAPPPKSHHKLLPQSKRGRRLRLIAARGHARDSCLFSLSRLCSRRRVPRVVAVADCGGPARRESKSYTHAHTKGTLLSLNLNIHLPSSSTAPLLFCLVDKTNLPAGRTQRLYTKALCNISSIM